MNNNVRTTKTDPSTQQLALALKQNEHTLVVMMPDEFLEYVILQKKRTGQTIEQITEWMNSLIIDSTEISQSAKQDWLRQKERIKNAGSFLPVLSDTKTLVVLATEMYKGGHILSKYRVNTHAGRAYVVLKGYPGLRSQLNSTRYLANNPKVVSMGIGKLGVAKAIKGGIVISIIFSVAFHALEQLVNDRATWHDFVAGVSIDVASAVAGASIAWGVVSTIVGATAMAAIGPIALVVVVGAGITLALNAVNSHFGLTEKLATMLKQAESRMVSNIQKIRNEVYRGLSYAEEDPIGFMHALFGVPYFRQ
ncbi:hypothetical protein [Teredinibacter haidensis]|uniref:hypothetical protein n=1 Tax=Teredinibacter haidensis TaxID=2731755 RepID=UPI000948CD0D|nr:hypothetical protein [Teredinibacter haidensis]